jgi:hypothetical protein
MHTAYVCGLDSKGLILEKPIQPGESLREGTYLDVDAELCLVREAKEAMELAGDKTTTTERKAMKELGLRRAHHFGWSNTSVLTKAMGEIGHGRDAPDPAAPGGRYAPGGDHAAQHHHQRPVGPSSGVDAGHAHH